MAPPHLKGALVDEYAQIALFDAAENQRVILESQKREAQKKADLRKVLDAQVRMQQEAMKREKEEDLEFVRRENERIKIWNAEERAKIEANKAKNAKIADQRAQQLRELAAIRQREADETQQYDMTILRSIHKEIKQERAKEAAKRAEDAANLKLVAEQNVIHMAEMKRQKAAEQEAMRKLESQWTELLDKQERARDRQLQQTYSRQAKQYGAAASMQEVMDKIAAEDEARANFYAKKLEEAAKKRDADQKAERARLQQEMLDVLALQVHEKSTRGDADKQREAMVVAREREELERAEKADQKRRAMNRVKNAEYAKELGMQMAVQEERKILEPFLMSKAERQMNAALLRKLP